MSRDPALTTLYASLFDAVARAPSPPAGAREAAGLVSARLQLPGEAAPPASRKPPVAAAHLPSALGAAERHVPALAGALAALAERLTWAARPGSDAVPGDFEHRHANALIAGPEGLERRDDLRIGVSLMAPDTRYPDHRHPPEEVYVVLSEGEWRQEAGPWHRPGPGGLVYNPHNIVHAMRAGPAPLLALWMLPT